MTARQRLIATAIAVIIITAAVAIAKMNGPAGHAVAVATVGVAGFCVVVAARINGLVAIPDADRRSRRPPDASAGPQALRRRIHHTVAAAQSRASRR